jgi:mRNA interferase RelE/StbE
VTWSTAARKHFLALDQRARQRVAALIDQLSENPRPANVKALVGLPGVLRARTGDYRVLYTVDETEHQVWVEDVRHRSKAYGGH